MSQSEERKTAREQSAPLKQGGDKLEHTADSGKDAPVTPPGTDEEDTAQEDR